LSVLQIYKALFRYIVFGYFFDFAFSAYACYIGSGGIGIKRWGDIQAKENGAKWASLYLL
jgi:hypothetical protein